MPSNKASGPSTTVTVAQSRRNTSRYVTCLVLLITVSFIAHLRMSAQSSDLQATPTSEDKRSTPNSESGPAADSSQQLEISARFALGQEPNSAAILNDLAQALHAEGNQLAAMYFWKRAAGLDSSNLKIQLSVAALTADLGDMDSSLKELQAILAVDPDFEPALFEMAEVLCRVGDYQKGIEMLQRALTLDPQDAAARLSLGKALLSLQRYSDASLVMAQYVASHPGDAEAHYLLGASYLGEQQLNDAEEEFRSAHRISSTLPQVNRDLGIALLREGKAHQALPYLDQAVEEDPDNPDAHFFRLQAYKSLHLTDAANVEVGTISRLKSQQVEKDRISLLVSQAKKLTEANQLEAALELYRSALKIAPHDANLLYELSVIEGELGQITAEETDLRQAEREDPAMAAVHNQLGTVEIGRGRYEEAKRELELATKASPFYYAALGNLGVAYARLGDMQQAVQSFEQATEVNPEYKQGYLNLGLLFASAGDFAKANQALQRALAIDPSDQSAANVLNQIKMNTKP